MVDRTKEYICICICIRMKEKRKKTYRIIPYRIL